MYIYIYNFKKQYFSREESDMQNYFFDAMFKKKSRSILLAYIYLLFNFVINTLFDNLFMRYYKYKM